MHITVDNTGHYLLMAHNVTESAASLRLGPDRRLGPLTTQPEHPKLGYVVHQIRIDTTNRWVFVPVRVRAYDQAGDGLLRWVGSYSLPGN